MSLKTGEKVLLSESSMEIEVVGTNPTGQPFQVSISDSKVYRVKINGVATALKEDILNKILASGKVTPIEKMVTAQPIEKETLLKKRLGRPPLKKEGEI